MKGASAIAGTQLCASAVCPMSSLDLLVGEGSTDRVWLDVSESHPTLPLAPSAAVLHAWQPLTNQTTVL